MKHYVIAIILFLTMQLYAITITKSDYGFAPGKIRNFMEGSWNVSSTDLTSGSGKSWNFTTPTVGYQNNTYASCSNVTGFPGATLIQQYTQFILGYTYDGTIYIQETADDYIQIGYIGSPNVVWNPGIPTGLPHYLNKTWQSTHTWVYGTYNITGTVIADGMLTTHWGTHQALLVKYHYVTNSLTYDCYQWETKEFGIEAFSNTLNSGMLYVLNEAEPNAVPNSDDTHVPVVSTVTPFPNPAKGIVNLKVTGLQSRPASISIFNIRGEEVFYQNNLPKEDVIQWNGRDKEGRTTGSGLYFYRMTAGNKSIKGSFIYLR